MKLNKKKFLNSINTLDFKVGCSLVLVAIIPLMIYIFLNSRFVVNNFLNLEKQNIEYRTKQASGILDIQSQEMLRLVKDYSIWDETYNNTLSMNKLWFKKNFSDFIPLCHDVDLIVVVNNEKKILDLYGVTSDKIDSLLQDEFMSKILEQNYYNELSMHPHGLKICNGNLYALAACPILNENMDKPSQGLVIIGRRISPELLSRINTEFGYLISIIFEDKIISTPNAYENTIEYYNTLKNNKKPEGAIIMNSNIMGNIPIYDISQKNIGYLCFGESRTLFIATLELVSKNGYTVLLISMSIIILLSSYIKNLISKPIEDFEEQLTNMVKNNSPEHVIVKGTNEMARLAETFNWMTDNLYIHKKENENLKTLSITDSLTSLYNHKYFFEYFRKIVSYPGKKLVVLFCDIDHFKLINDSHGHSVGDLVLKEVVKIMNNIAGEKAHIFRYGGEEFIVLLEDCDIDYAHKVAERIRIKVSMSHKVQQYSHFFPITISIGLASYPGHALSAETLIEKADKAMYFAKQHGRNQCHVYNSNIDDILDDNNFEFNKQEMLLSSVYALTAAIDAKDKYTEKHSESVSKYALQLAEKINLSEKDKYALRIGGLLHDIGKIGVPDNIIHKSTPLTQEEWKIVKSHPLLGSDIIKYIINTPEILSCIKYHHEKWDGTGYPEGLSGNSIPLYARIICIADAFHAMISERPYRQALTQSEAFYQLELNKNIQFDPKLVDAFIESFKIE